MVVHQITRREVPSNLPYSNGYPPEINIMTIEDLKLNRGANLPSAQCGPSLRLTPSAARESGMARQLNGTPCVSYRILSKNITYKIIFPITTAALCSEGSAWYSRKMNVREGFDTYIRFQISNPSQKCDRLDDVNTYCRSRGADGLAFVIQNTAKDALGTHTHSYIYECSNSSMC